MYHRIVLPNGVRILAEKMSTVRSAALGIWVGTGSRHERAEEAGAAHFIEHMVFKGTGRRTAAALAREMDAVGGQVNAFTSKESTCFYARVLDTHLDKALDILCDMVFSSRFDEGDVQLERQVILEEIGMYEDTPEDLCAERLFAAVYKGSALARPILGKAATLEKMTGEWLRAYQRDKYRGDDIVVSLAGSFSHDMLERMKARLSDIAPGAVARPRAVRYRPAISTRKKAIEQNHLTLAFPGLPYGDGRRYAAQMLSSILGGGMSSRLFQEVREKRGLCYSVYSYGAGHAETGLFAVYTALGAETERKALDTIIQVLREFAEQGPTAEEVERTREQTKANVLMGLESSQARMNHLGRSELMLGQVPSAEEIIDRYDAVTAEQIRALAETLLRFDQASLSAVGRVRPKEEYQTLLAEAK